MSAGDGLRVFIVAMGVVILVVTTISLARKHMTESFCIAWGVVAVGAICAGIILRPSGWSQYVSWHGLVLILLGVVFLLAGAFYFSLRLSQLNREVKELAIRVALLDQENAVLLDELGQLPEEHGPAELETEKHEEEAAVRH